jgi:hypothetical protein
LTDQFKNSPKELPFTALETASILFQKGRYFLSFVFAKAAMQPESMF